MNSVIWGQYTSADYPLKHFFYNEIPEKIKTVLKKLCESKLAVFRGGIAFVCLLNKTGYELKDLDMLSTNDNCDAVIDILKESDIVYVNKNSFEETVITAFWKDDKEFFKLDVLINNKLPKLTSIVWESNTIYSVSASYIWRNRLEKIAEKEIRCHDEKKTKNHYNVVMDISNHLSENRFKIFDEDAVVVEKILSEVEFVLMGVISKSEVIDFIALQRKILKR